MTNFEFDNVAEPVYVYINGKPTNGKEFDDGNAHTWTSSDFNYQLNTQYPITMFEDGGGAIQGVGEFDDLVGCSVSNTNWNGNNSTPIYITFLSNVSSIEFGLQS